MRELGTWSLISSRHEARLLFSIKLRKNGYDGDSLIIYSDERESIAQQTCETVFNTSNSSH